MRKKRSSIQKNIVNDRNEEERKKLKKEKWCFLKEHLGLWTGGQACADFIHSKSIKNVFVPLLLFEYTKILKKIYTMHYLF